MSVSWLQHDNNARSRCAVSDIASQHSAHLVGRWAISGAPSHRPTLCAHVGPFPSGLVQVQWPAALVMRQAQLNSAWHRWSKAGQSAAAATSQGLDCSSLESGKLVCNPLKGSESFVIREWGLWVLPVT